MSKVFQSSTISKILSTNKPNTIEVNNDNIIESDSEFREVIKKGYLLTQINLSTIPDIIQDAIDKAILDAKTQTLADSLISTMRQTIENFDDGVYKKTYIDTTITYLEELLTQKASPEIVASIAEAKIAVATAEFATASQVGILSSRVGSSESEILNVKETINTKDTARATQIEELQASINQSLSNYSDVIELYIDADGNIRSQKIENLEAKNSLKKVSITELNQVVLDEAGNYSAIVANAILDSDGKIVGFTFSDTNELTTFTINADTFKISNSTNTRTPFRIENNELYFDGKVSFSNITDKTSVVTMDNVEDAITNNVTTIDGGKIVASDMFINNINAKGGIVADSIKGNTIDGITITGSFINGAIIYGATIRASYLDLDGEIEVLTDFYLCVDGNTTGVPTQAITEGRYRTYSASDIDAVPSSGYVNLYRIPTLSNITASSGFTSLNNGQTLYATLFSYNTANANSNKKVRKKRPTFNQGSGLMYYVSGFSTTGTSYATANDGGSYSLRLGSTTLFTFSFSSFAGVTGGSGGHGVCQTSFTWSKYGGASGAKYSSGNNKYNYVQETGGYSQTFTVSQTVTGIPVIGDVNITATIIVTPSIMIIDGGDQSFSEWHFPYSVDHTITCLSSSYELPFDWTNTSDRVYWRKNNAISGGQIKFLNLNINNMI